MSDVVKALAAIVIISLILIVGGVMVLIWFLRSRKEDEANLQQWAAQNGWRISPGASLPFTHALPHTNGKVGLLLDSVANGRPVAVADYQYEYSTEEFGPKDHHGTAMVVATRLSRPCPLLTVRPRGRLGRFSGALDLLASPEDGLLDMLGRAGKSVFGNKSRVSIGHHEFDEKFEIEVWKGDVGLARSVLGPMLVAALLAGPAFTWGVSGVDLFSWYGGGISDPNQIPARVTSLLRIGDLLGR